MARKSSTPKKKKKQSKVVKKKLPPRSKKKKQKSPIKKRNKMDTMNSNDNIFSFESPPYYISNRQVGAVECEEMVYNGPFDKNTVINFDLSQKSCK